MLNPVFSIIHMREMGVSVFLNIASQALNFLVTVHIFYPVVYKVLCNIQSNFTVILTSKLDQRRFCQQKQRWTSRGKLKMIISFHSAPLIGTTDRCPFLDDTDSLGTDWAEWVWLLF